jgi:hypothetical protein
LKAACRQEAIADTLSGPKRRFQATVEREGEKWVPTVR